MITSNPREQTRVLRFWPIKSGTDEDAWKTLTGLDDEKPDGLFESCKSQLKVNV